MNTGTKQLFLLIFASLLLTNLGFDSVFGIGQYFSLLSFLSPVPLAVAILIHGRRPVLSLTAVMIVFLAMLGGWFASNVTMMVVASIITAFYALLMAVIIESDIHPVKGIFYVGTVFVAILWSIIGGFELAFEGGVEQHLSLFVENSLKQVPDKSISAESLLNYIRTMGPVYVTIAPFLTLWACFLLTLRNSRFWQHKVTYSYSNRDIISFRTPDRLIYFLLLGLSMSLLGSYLQIAKVPLIGNILLGFVGVFYFFQGLGVFLDSLNYFKVGSVMRTFFLFFVILLAQIWLAVLGVLDTWFDFRKFFNKKLDGRDLQ